MTKHQEVSAAILRILKTYPDIGGRLLNLSVEKKLGRKVSYAAHQAALEDLKAKGAIVFDENPNSPRAWIVKSLSGEIAPKGRGGEGE